MPFVAIKPSTARLSPHSSLHLRAHATFAFNSESTSIYSVPIDGDSRQWFRQLFWFSFVVVMSRRSRSIWLTAHFMEDLIFGGHRFGAAKEECSVGVHPLFTYPHLPTFQANTSFVAAESQWWIRRLGALAVFSRQINTNVYRPYLHSPLSFQVFHLFHPAPDETPFRWVSNAHEDVAVNKKRWNVKQTTRCDACRIFVLSKSKCVNDSKLNRQHIKSSVAIVHFTLARRRSIFWLSLIGEIQIEWNIASRRDCPRTPSS